MECINKNDVNIMIDTFKNVINEATESSIPKKALLPKNKPLPIHIKSLIMTRNHYRRRWILNRLNYDKMEMNRLNKKIKEELINERNKSWGNVLASLNKGSSPFWNISKVLRKKYNNMPILKYEGVRYSTSQEKC